MTQSTHTVEKIGGTSMSRLDELIGTLFQRDDPTKIYNRMFVVSAFGGITDLLLEHKKSGEAGVYARFANDEDDHGWLDALSGVAKGMREAHGAVLGNPADLSDADDFVRDRVEGARNCLIDLQRLCSYGHFRLSQHMMLTRELLSGLGEAHSAYVATLALRRAGINARFVDLSGWRDEREMTLDERIHDGLDDVDVTEELPIVTGYAQCREGLMAEFDRGYSEVTFSRIAALTGAHEAIIHKEFHLSSADPKLVKGKVRKLGHTNYDVADQLSNMGMEAIHPKAAKTLRQADVALRVTNAFEPHDPGTLIDDQPAGTPGAEIVTGLEAHALELFEQDMVGVKGYDAKILELLTRHGIRIVSKTSNANTITHYVDAPLRELRKVERDLNKVYPSAELTIQPLAIAAVIGRDLSGLNVLGEGLKALAEDGVEVLAAHQTTRSVDVQFVVPRESLAASIGALHGALLPAAEVAELKPKKKAA
ncbi:aspartate/glutamate/uridylate kinase [Roseobacter sp. AzwK-3b]|uniref:aspartate kinase n=1 Tax=Roseobacter sp. AzwK-3b TaxID=351016 RepID=UPI000156AC9A|nr:aspartate kinase [Roseobacter sp. AzwK-3b]EDM70533.1 aspartate/glutamate/uridylate kinase [Roseobacter sp. AzwK-3b]